MSRGTIGAGWRRQAPLWTLCVALTAGGWAAGAVSQESDYAGITNREIKALSADETRGLLEGHGLGLALAAELNGYPGPKHVLELRQEMALSLGQRGEVEALFERMRSAAVTLGEQIVERERQLDQAFVSGSIDAARLDRMSEEIGRLRGRLRAVHLQAHLETRAILSPEQQREYAALRGYGSPGDHDPSQHHDRSRHGNHGGTG